MNLFIYINKCFNLLNTLKWQVIRIFSNILTKYFMFLKSIKYGKNCQFYGLPTFLKSGDSKFIIGKNCSFRSLTSSNLIGVNRPCIFSLHSDKSELIIGDNCGFSGTVIGCFTKIVLGKNVRCGANTLITDSDWHLDDPRSNAPRPVFIDDNVWLGEGVKVLKGVKIGKNSLIGAGSVVVKDIPPNVIAAGNPCKVIKSIKS